MTQLALTIDCLRELNMASVFLRMTLAVICGGMIGLEREQRRQPAGFRTYVLICLGSATAMMLGEYDALMLVSGWGESAAQPNTDVCRFGAQVINGIGFLGAGTIIVTGRQEVKGLTTSAGLWASACMGLAIGAGFYECMLIGFMMIVMTNNVLRRLESFVLTHSKIQNIYLEFDDMADLGAIVAEIKAMGASIYEVDIDRFRSNCADKPSAVISLRLPHRQIRTHLLTALAQTPSVRTVEEL